MKQEGVRVVLVNSNPATIMTDLELADATYIEPLTVDHVAPILEMESPDAILPTVGGQTALNLAVALSDAGVLDRLGVRLIGARVESVRLAEDRERFKQAMIEAGLDVPRSGHVASPEEALELSESLGYPAILRPSFTLGGTGGGIAYNREELTDLVKRGLRLSPIHRVPHRGVSPRVEGVRARGDARCRLELHGHLLDRELRPHGSPYRGFDQPSLRRRP